MANSKYTAHEKALHKHLADIRWETQKTLNKINARIERNKAAANLIGR